MGPRGSAPEGHPIITSRTQTLPQSTIPITPTTTRNAGTTGVTGETAWAPGQATTATRGTATITIIITAAEEAAMTGSETGTETATTPTALTPDTTPTLTARRPTACLPPYRLTLRTPPPKTPPLPRVQMLPPVQREDLCPQPLPIKTTTLIITPLCRHHLLLRPRRSHQPLSSQRPSPRRSERWTLTRTAPPAKTSGRNPNAVPPRRPPRPRHPRLRRRPNLLSHLPVTLPPRPPSLTISPLHPAPRRLLIGIPPLSRIPQMKVYRLSTTAAVWTLASRCS